MKISSLFKGRLTRKEYWIRLIIVFLFIAIVRNLPGADQPIYNPNVWFPLFLIFVGIIYYWSILIRRLHDIKKSGWQSLISIIPFVGIIYVLILGTIATKTTKGMEKILAKNNKMAED